MTEMATQEGAGVGTAPARHGKDGNTTHLQQTLTDLTEDLR